MGMSDYTRLLSPIVELEIEQNSNSEPPRTGSSHASFYDAPSRIFTSTVGWHSELWIGPELANLLPFHSNGLNITCSSSTQELQFLASY